jgi:RAB protein geranylgeranyltransferase component A
MDDTYDVIVLGTGLKECILAGLLAKTGNCKPKNKLKINKNRTKKNPSIR